MFLYFFQSPVDPFHGNSVIENTTPRPLWEHGSPQVVEHNTVLPYRPSPHPIKPIHTTTTTTAEPPVPVDINGLIIGFFYLLFRKKFIKSIAVKMCLVLQNDGQKNFVSVTFC